MVSPFAVVQSQQKGYKTAGLLLLLFAGVLYSFIVRFVNKSAQFNLASSTKIEQETDSEINSEEDIGAENSLSLQLVMDKGQSLQTLLRQNKVARQEITKLELALKRANKKVKSNSKLTLDLTTCPDQEDLFNIAALSIHSPDNAAHIRIEKAADGFSIQEQILQLVKSIVKIKTEINGSLFSALKNLGMPLNAVNELIAAYSHQIDFQRQVKSGDFIEFLIEKYTTESNDFAHYGNIVFAKLNLDNQVYDVYRYTDSNNRSAYFSKDGKSFRRNLLKTPVKAARISGHFGNRIHPILGYTKMHKGIDFAAPKGTPIYSAGDGIITEVGTKGGYGNYIKVKHSSNLSTMYAHISKVQKGVKVGSKVQQGKVIAYVGATGSATGPHLHYEVHIGGRPVNPLSIKTLPDSSLGEKHLDKFKLTKAQLLDIDKFLDNNESYRLSQAD